jgi:hypothetical protein
MCKTKIYKYFKAKFSFIANCHRRSATLIADARRSQLHESSHTSVVVADDSRCVSKFPTNAQNGPVQRKVHDFCQTSVDYFLAC